jgi:selenide,water dikinase
VLKELAPLKDENLLVGYDTNDDAAVYRLTPELAVISTVDFITPPVDDPYWFGQIAAANSLSDVYAMGGQPLMALNLVMFPSKALDLGLLKDILRGGNDKVTEAGACMAGGHSVDDNEPKYGLAVTGCVHPERIFTNGGARPGDALVLTKPLGSGVLFNANRSGRLPYRELEAVLPLIAALNAQALAAAGGFDVHACTDITGFGILGHSVEMAKGSAARLQLSFRDLPLYPHALAMYEKGETTGSNTLNRRAVEGFWEPKAGLSASQEELLFDPQTSGGLLFAVPEAQAGPLVKALQSAGAAFAARIGEVSAAARPSVCVG